MESAALFMAGMMAVMAIYSARDGSPWIAVIATALSALNLYAAIR